MSEAMLEISPDEDAFNADLPLVSDTVVELLGGNALNGYEAPFGVELWQTVEALRIDSPGKMGTNYSRTTLGNTDFDYADPPPAG